MPVVTDPTDTSGVKEAVARTYSPAVDVDGWDLVQQYERVQEVVAAHPDWGRHRIAAAVGENVPPGRVRGWAHGDVRPDSYRVLEVCDAYDMLSLSWDGEQFAELVFLVACVFTTGSVSETWVPSFTLENTRGERVRESLRRLGFQVRIVHDDSAKRATEARPVADASPLGRLLTVLGAPRGRKHETAGVTVPPWVSQAPESVKLRFSRAYVWTRGVVLPERPQTPVQIDEQRTQSFKQALGTVFESVTEGTAVANVGSNIRLTRTGAKQLMRPPKN